MKSQSKTKATSQEVIDAMSDTSGEKENIPAPTYKLPSFKINGKTGGFWRTSLDENEDLVLGDDGKCLLGEIKDPSGVILMTKMLFIQEEKKDDFQLFTNEGIKSSIFSVFQKRETKKGFSTTMIFQGNPAQIKAEFPDIKMIQIIYFLLDETNEIIRLKVKGLGLGRLFNYWKELNRNKEHSFQFHTLLGKERVKTAKGTVIANTFTRGKLITDLSDVKVAMDEVKERTEAIIKYNQEREQERNDSQEREEIEIESEDEPEEEGVEPESTTEDKIDVKDLPLD